MRVWAGLVLCAVAGCGGGGGAPVVVPSLPVGAVAVQPDQVAPMLALVNTARAEAGCEALVPEARLMRAAEGHARAMAEQDFFSHTGADGSSAARRVSAQGYRWGLVGENIAAGSSSAPEAFATWAASPGHRANMLTCAFVQTGIAVVHQADDQPLPGNGWAMHHYWVQVFGSPL